MAGIKPRGPKRLIELPLTLWGELERLALTPGHKGVNALVKRICTDFTAARRPPKALSDGTKPWKKLFND